MENRRQVKAKKGIRHEQHQQTNLFLEYWTTRNTFRNIGGSQLELVIVADSSGQPLKHYFEDTRRQTNELAWHTPKR